MDLSTIVSTLRNINWKKEIFDQFAHLIAGLIVTLLISQVLSIYLSAIVVSIFAVGREIYQRLVRKDVWYGCSWGCRTDLIFWAFGIYLAVFIYTY